MVKSVKSARGRYQQHMEDQAVTKELDAKELKRKIVSEKLEEVRKKKVAHAEVIADNIKEANRMSKEAETNRDFILLTRSNTLRDSNEEKEKLIKELEKMEADLISRRDSIV